MARQSTFSSSCLPPLVSMLRSWSQEQDGTHISACDLCLAMPKERASACSAMGTMTQVWTATTPSLAALIPGHCQYVLGLTGALVRLQTYNYWGGLPVSVLAGILEGLGWRDVCRAAAASRVFLEAGRSQRVLSFDGVDTEGKVLEALCCMWRTWSPCLELSSARKQRRFTALSLLACAQETATMLPWDVSCAFMSFTLLHTHVQVC